MRLLSARVVPEFCNGFGNFGNEVSTGVKPEYGYPGMVPSFGGRPPSVKSSMASDILNYLTWSRRCRNPRSSRGTSQARDRVVESFVLLKTAFGVGRRQAFPLEQRNCNRGNNGSECSSWFWWAEDGNCLELSSIAYGKRGSLRRRMLLWRGSAIKGHHNRIIPVG